MPDRDGSAPVCQRRLRSHACRRCPRLAAFLTEVKRRASGVLVQTGAAVRRAVRAAGDRRSGAGHARRQCERVARSPATMPASCCTQTLHAYGFATQAGRQRARRRVCADRAAASPTRSSACRPATSRRRRKCAPATAISRPILRTVPDGGAILALGRIAHDATLRALGYKPSAFAFAHGAAACAAGGPAADRQLSLQPLQHQHAPPDARDVPRCRSTPSRRHLAATDRTTA